MKKIVFIVGESSCGKSTLISNLIKRHPKTYSFIKSTVTRDPRPGEVDGVNYDFIDEQVFLCMDMEDLFVQTVKFGGNYYGTTLEEFQKPQEIGLVAVTHEGIHDIKEGLESRGIEMEYEIIFYATPDTVLRNRGVDWSRVERGNIRVNFLSEYLNGKFDGISVNFISDQYNYEDELPLILIADELHKRVSNKGIVGHYNKESK